MTVENCGNGWLNAVAASSYRTEKIGNLRIHLMPSLTSDEILLNAHSAASKTSAVLLRVTTGLMKPSFLLSASPPPLPTSSNNQMSLGPSHLNLKFAALLCSAFWRTRLLNARSLLADLGRRPSDRPRYAAIAGEPSNELNFDST